MIFNLFPPRPDHPLADGKELKRIVAELRTQSASRAIDEVSSWFESLKYAENFRLDHYFDVLNQLDDVAQPHLRRLRRDYLQTPGLSKAAVESQWKRNHGYFQQLAELYAACLGRAILDPKSKGSEAFKAFLPLTEVRLQAARCAQLKWLAYRYAPAATDLWIGLGQTYLAAEAAGHAQKPVQLYTSLRGTSTVAQLYLHAAVLSISAVDSLPPPQIELVDRLIAHFLPGFDFSADCRADSTYWLDAAAGTTPVRFAPLPGAERAGLRFISSGTALAALEKLLHVVERGEIPGDLDLGGETSAKQLLTVLRHLCVHWALRPPQRQHSRHQVRTRMAVVHGFDEAYRVFADDLRHLEQLPEVVSWLADNVSLGGFRASIQDRPGDESIQLGTLICVQAEGSQHRLLGVVRRFGRRLDAGTDLGVQLLARQADGVQLQPRRSGFSAATRVRGIWLRDDGQTDVMRIVLPLGHFSVRETMEFHHQGKTHLLTPLELEESGFDYEIAHFRETC